MKKTITALFMIFVLAFTANVFAETYMYNLDKCYDNSAGQRVIEIHDYTGGLALQVLGRGSNVYDATNKRLVTSNCKGKEYFTVGYNNATSSLDIIWVDTSGMLWYDSTLKSNPSSKGLWSGGALNAVLNGSTGSAVNNNSVNSSQVPVQTESTSTIGNMPRKASVNYSLTATINGATYNYSVTGGKLQLKGANNSVTVIAEDVQDAGFLNQYIVYLTKSEEIWAVEIGKRSTGKLILEDIRGLTISESRVTRIMGENDFYEVEKLLDDIEEAYDSSNTTSLTAKRKR